MSNDQSSGLFTTCTSVCWILAVVFGLFLASVCLYWLGMHGLVGAIIGLIGALAVGYVLPQIVCSADGSQVTYTADTGPAPAVKPAPAPAPKAGKAAEPMMYDSRPDDADDLKVISGVGPGLEKTLNEMGVYKFSQIASWKKADVEWVDGRLKFKGRIERDDWVKQARKLAKS